MLQYSMRGLAILVPCMLGLPGLHVMVQERRYSCALGPFNEYVRSWRVRRLPIVIAVGASSWPYCRFLVRQAQISEKLLAVMLLYGVLVYGKKNGQNCGFSLGTYYNGILLKCTWWSLTLNVRLGYCILSEVEQLMEGCSLALHSGYDMVLVRTRNDSYLNRLQQCIYGSSLSARNAANRLYGDMIPARPFAICKKVMKACRWLDI